MDAPAVHTRAKRIIVLDTETTGVQRYDRIVTLGAVRLEGNEIGRALHLVFDPRQDSHPQAYAVHGWCDWTTRFQDLFADWAPRIFEWLSWADEIVAHNAAFDMHYVQRELRKAEVGQLSQPAICTMEMSRTKWRGQSAKLDDCLGRVGLRRVGQQHGALEDAVLTAGLLLNITGQNSRLIEMLKTAKRWPGPTNVRLAPPRPDGALPRRAPKRALR
ncbi:DNA polymerase III subunit epsilon [Mesorhizobium sp. Root157]|uniref:3'-5' exonuclease n=1 Tax=Mesorhizobium sp. Root157 TaxID=1736477 RepID=UPI0006F1C7CB|nr:exonuclease domain-containing protein [Mesorhizobium sp. Root157]KQZ98532.1 DNA polymerase III subunit epsilon [Mesorhizobium sp. Root157]